MSGARSTQPTNDEDMLNGMPGFEDEANESGGDEGSQGEGEGAPDRNEGRTADPGTEQGRGTDPAGESTTDPERIVRRNDGLVERQSADDPRRRDLVDPVTGQVVAKGGIERRVYENGKRAEREAHGLKQQVTQLQARLQGVDAAGGLGKQLGLAPEVQAMALQTMANFMKDPVNTLEYLIAEVKAKGYNIPSLSGQGGTDMAALQRMLDERLAPLRQQSDREQHMARAQAKAQEDLDNFLGEMPDARANLDVMAEMLKSDSSLSLHSAYARFLLWCSGNSLDPTQHVGMQLQARQQAQQPQPGQQPRTQRPLPNGRQMSGNGTVPANSRPIDHDTSWENIIRDSMVDAGYQQ